MRNLAVFAFALCACSSSTNAALVVGVDAGADDATMPGLPAPLDPVHDPAIDAATDPPDVVGNDADVPDAGAEDAAALSDAASPVDAAAPVDAGVDVWVGACALCQSQQIPPNGICPSALAPCDFTCPLACAPPPTLLSGPSGCYDAPSPYPHPDTGTPWTAWCCPASAVCPF